MVTVPLTPEKRLAKDTHLYRGTLVNPMEQHLPEDECPACSIAALEARVETLEEALRRIENEAPDWLKPIARAALAGGAKPDIHDVRVLQPGETVEDDFNSRAGGAK